MSVVFPVGYFQGPQPESAVPPALVALAPGPSLRPTRDVKSATAHEQINMLLLLLLLVLLMVKKIKKIKDSRRARVDLPVDRTHNTCMYLIRNSFVAAVFNSSLNGRDDPISLKTFYSK